LENGKERKLEINKNEAEIKNIRNKADTDKRGKIVIPRNEEYYWTQTLISCKRGNPNSNL
jgi:hypothetical protein